MKRRAFVRAGAAAGLASVMSSIRADPDFPNRPITFVVPFAAGGGGDAIARMMGKELSSRTGVAVIVENRAGAGGNIGAAYVLRAKPDGYTLLNMSSTYAIQAAVSKVPFDPIGDMQPIIMLSTDPAIVLTLPDSPLKDASAVVAAGKAQPGRLKYGSAGVGSIAHLAMVELGLHLNIDLQHIPYKGTSQAYTDLMAGSIDMMLSGTTFAAPQIRSGRVRAFGIAGTRRSTSLPDVPTFAEQGFPEFQVHDWKAIGAPRGVAPSIVAYLNRELNAALGLQNVTEKLAGEGIVRVGGSPEDMMKVIQRDVEHWKEIARVGNVTVD